jgi:hypothetical protein
MKTTTIPNAGALRLTAAALLALLGGCASPAPQTSSSSNWLTCKTVDDCTPDPSAVACKSGYCVDSSGQRIVLATTDAGSGGKTASGGSTGSGGKTGSGGRTASGGSTGSGGGSGASGGEPSYCASIGNSDLDGATIASLFGDAAASCTLDVSNYDRSCVENIDCVNVGVGNACQTPCEVECPNAAINTAAKARYDADFAATPVAACSSIFCGCPCIGGPRCVKGQCEFSYCGAPVDAGTP